VQRAPAREAASQEAGMPRDKRPFTMPPRVDEHVAPSQAAANCASLSLRAATTSRPSSVARLERCLPRVVLSETGQPT
jgi:hypothetical protein